MPECGGASISEERDRVLVTLKWKTEFADTELPGNQERFPLTHAAETCCRP